MNIAYINNLLGEVKMKLESLDPANEDQLDEQKTAVFMNNKKTAAARKRLDRLRDKNKGGYKIDAKGAKR
jgi:hypothetical protein